MIFWAANVDRLFNALTCGSPASIVTGNSLLVTDYVAVRLTGLYEFGQIGRC